MENDLILKVKLFYSKQKTQYLYRETAGSAYLSMCMRNYTLTSKRSCRIGIPYQLLPNQLWLLNWDMILLKTWNRPFLTKITRWPLPNISFILWEQVFFTNYNLRYTFYVRYFGWILELVQGGISSLGIFYTIMDILWGVESGLVLKTSPDHKVNLMSIENSPTNNNLCVIGSSDFNTSFNICNGNFSIIM